MTNQKAVVLNTPKSINTSYLFNLVKLKSKHKITNVNYYHLVMVIHQINFFTTKYGWCDFDSKGYYQMFGCTPNVVSCILSVLDDEGIIKRTRRGNNENGKVSSYVYLEPFNYNNPDETDEYKFLTNYKGTPKFINVWVENKFKIVRKPEKEKGIKPEPKLPKVKSLSKAEQARLIVELEAEIARLRGLLSNDDSSVSAIITAPVVASNGVIFQSVKNNKFSKNKPETDEVKLNHEAPLHEETIDVKEFEYEGEKFIVRNWNIILENKNPVATEAELYEEIYDCDTHKTESIYYGNVLIKKRYDYNKQINYVEVIAA